MKSFIVSVIALLSVMIVPFAAQAQTTAIGNNTTSLRRQSFNTGWTFHLKGSSEQSLVTLPHDAMIESKRDANNPGGSGIAFSMEVSMFIQNTSKFRKNGPINILPFSLKVSIRKVVGYQRQ